MDRSLDLSIVKKEPGLASLCPSDSGLFDSMIQDGYHDNNFQSMVSKRVVNTKHLALTTYTHNHLVKFTQYF